jgi:hypothetical protein
MFVRVHTLTNPTHTSFQAPSPLLPSRVSFRRSSDALRAESCLSEVSSIVRPPKRGKFPGGFTSSSNRERLSFCWIGFCARDDFKPSEVKWRLLPWPPPRVNDNLQTCPTVYESGTLVLVTIPAFFCKISTLTKPWGGPLT